MLSDEEMMEMSENLAVEAQVLDEQLAQEMTLIQESIEDQEREDAYRQAECPHEDTSEEMSNQVYRNGAVELVLVCHDCGAERPTGRFTSVT